MGPGLLEKRLDYSDGVETVVEEANEDRLQGYTADMQVKLQKDALKLLFKVLKRSFEASQSFSHSETQKVSSPPVY